MKNERTATVTWHKPEEQLPEDDIIVLVVCRGQGENVAFCDAMELATYDCDECEWILESYPGITGITVSWWCELPNVPDEEADAE